jgi:hypothetical protein
LSDATPLSEAQQSELVRDTLNGVLAFVVPGPDPYSIAQGASTPEPGGVDAAVLDKLIQTLDLSAPFLPQFSAQVAGILNNVAQAVNPAASGPFPSPFARLSFREKVAVLQIMDATEPLKFLAGVLPAIVAYLCYSDASRFDPSTQSLPIGWTISNYSGMAHGRDDFRGYFEGRHSVDGKDS